VGGQRQPSALAREERPQRLQWVPVPLVWVPPVVASQRQPTPLVACAVEVVVARSWPLGDELVADR